MKTDIAIVASANNEREPQARSSELLGVPDLTRYNFNSIFHKASMARMCLETGVVQQAKDLLAEIQDMADYCTRHGNTGDLKTIEQVRAALPGTPNADIRRGE